MGYFNVSPEHKYSYTKMNLYRIKTRNQTTAFLNNCKNGGQQVKCKET